MDTVFASSMLQFVSRSLTVHWCALFEIDADILRSRISHGVVGILTDTLRERNEANEFDVCTEPRQDLCAHHLSTRAQSICQMLAGACVLCCECYMFMRRVARYYAQ